MPLIMPIKDLRNTTEISNIAHKEQEPIFTTKSLYPFLVMKIGSCSLCAILEISVVLGKSLIGIISGLIIHSFHC